MELGECINVNSSRGPKVYIHRKIFALSFVLRDTQACFQIVTYKNYKIMYGPKEVYVTLRMAY